MACCKKRTTIEAEAGRERWDTRGAFIVAALASSVGFAAVWRFPWIAYKFGGGSFFIPYFAAVLFVGIPILSLEFSLGQVFQSGNVVAFGSISKRLRGLGVASLYAGFMIAGYYSCIMAYTLFYFVNSFFGQPWASPNSDGTLENAKQFWTSNTLHFSDVPTGVLAANLFGGLIVTWAFTYFAIKSGPHSLSKVIPATFFIAFGILGSILGRALFLPGGFDGMMYYFGNWDFATLLEPTVWSESVSQVLLSSGLGLGIMTAYASYNNQNQGAILDSVLVSLFNAGFSVFCGLVVFSLLGFVSNYTGTPIGDLVDHGLSLAFVTYPVALSMLPLPMLWNALFFSSLFLLGVNTVFSLAEAVITVFNDSRAYKEVPRYAVCSAIAATGFALSAMYAADIGVKLVDAMDHYINNYLLLAVAFFECISVGWIYCADQQRRQIGAFSTVFMGLTFFIGAIGGIGSCLILRSESWNPLPGLEWWWGAVAGLGVSLVGTIISLIAARTPYADSNEIQHGKVWWLLLSNPEMARSDINSVVAKRGCGITVFWSLLMKYVLPVGLLAMFGINMQGAVNAAGYKAEAYSLGYQIFGVATAGFGIVLVALGAFFPALFTSLLPPEVRDQSLAQMEKDPMMSKTNAVELSERDDGAVVTEAGIAISV